MSTPHSGRGMRRGFLTALAGVAIWLFAIILSGHVSGSIETAGTGLLAFVTGTMQAWIQSPGVEVWQLAAYTGLAMIVVGPAWFWVVGPASKTLRQGISVPSVVGDSEPVAVVEHVTDGGDSGIDAAEPATEETERIFSDDPRSRTSDRALGLLEAIGHRTGPLVPEQPTGDFLRSSSGRDAAGEGDEGDSSGPARAQVRYTDSDSVTTSEDDEPEESVADSALEPVEESGPAPEAKPSRASEPTAPDPTPSGEDPTEAIATAVSEAREKIATVKDRMPPIDGPSSINPARNGLSSVQPIATETIQSITEES